VIAAHLPVLQVVIPLLAAPVCVVLRRSVPAWAVATLVGWASLAISILLLLQTLQQGTISYALGSWAAPWGIEYRIDPLNAFVLTIVSLAFAIVLPYAYLSARREISRDRLYLFYAMLLLCFTGALGIVVTGDAFNLFVFLEISSLSSYVLISLGRDRRALVAAFRYLVLGTIGATFILIGIGLAYMATGTLNMADLAERLRPLGGNRTVQASFAFLTVGIALKLALFPLHLWLPNAYTYAPSAVSAFLAATGTKVAAYVLLRFVFTVYGAPLAFDALPLEYVLTPLALLAMVVGAVVAVFQTDLKRLLAYSTIGQVGYIALGIAMHNADGLTASIVHLFNHALIKGGLFLALGCVMYRMGTVELADLEGLGRRMPLTCAAFVAGGLGLIGVPLTAGFISKWYLVKGAIAAGWWPAAVLVLLSSLVAVVYVWRVAEVLYRRTPAPATPKDEAPTVLVVAAWLPIAASLWFGIDSTAPVSIAARAAHLLLGLAP
jgi:multicomponent Na+:H+ antiporter subunit D